MFPGITTRLIGLTGLVLSGAGCMRRSELQIEDGSTAHHLEFRIGRSRNADEPVASLRRIVVETCYGQPGTEKVFWQAERDSGSTLEPPMRVEYGVTPPGFQNVAGPDPLVGHCLEGKISGDGVSASVRFAVDSTGTITTRSP